MNDNTTNTAKKKWIQIGLASPETIRSWSYGEVTKPETINYKSLKPEKEGLFDERIFGPVKNYECACGKYKKIRNKGKVCERCHVEITEASVRRERMGHIELEEPVAHIWMLKSAPSRMSLLLNINTRKLEEVIYFVSYIVLDPGSTTNLKAKMVLDLSNAKASEQTRNRITKTLENILEGLDKESFDAILARELMDELKNTTLPFSMDECGDLIKKHTGAEFGIGAVAIETLLKQLDLKEEIKNIKAELAKEQKNTNNRLKLINRLEVLSGLYESKTDPAWMIMHVIPVIPPDIRPIIQLDGGRFTASEINDLYRRFIIRNERLKQLKAIHAPTLITNDAKRMLQEAADAFFDNENKNRPIVGKDNRPLKSLTSILKGKQGRFRQNLLGKRVDYSGRSVIVVGPELKMYQCGLPREMAIVLFKPFVIQQLVAQEIALNIKVADRMIENRNKKIWKILDQVTLERPVMLNRAPTLHRLGIQGFEVILVKGKAIRLHPLVTTAFNADFDGDQMAIHIPITKAAVAEVRGLMLGGKSILGPKDGNPIVGPTQDMILGNYYLSYEEKKVAGEGIVFKSLDEVLIAYQSKKVNLHALVFIPVSELPNKIFPASANNKLLSTTPGKLIFNQIFLEKFPYINNHESLVDDKLIENDLVDYNVDLQDYIAKRVIYAPLKSKDFSIIINRYFKTYDAVKTSRMLDNLKDLGFKFSHQSGTSISAGDVRTFKGKEQIFAKIDKKVSEITEYYEQGMLSEDEKKSLICHLWETTKNQVQEKVAESLKKYPKNPVFMMADSGARGNVSNFTQLIGMRGLMINPKGETIEVPIKSSFREGLSVSEYFISTHGARKGFADVALKTADAGYLTRRLVDAAQEIIILEEDCKSSKGFLISDIVETLHNSIIVPVYYRMWGRLSFDDITLPTGEVIPANTMLTEEIVNKMKKAKIKEIYIRSALTCEAKSGICVMCYGINLATSKLVKQGDAVGIMAAQSIGEPGTQLTMETFHTGGVSGESDITQGLPRIKELLDVTTPKGTVALIAEIAGKITKIEDNYGFYEITIESDFESRKQVTGFNVLLRVAEGDIVAPGQKLTEGAINIKNLLRIGSVNDVQNYILKEVQKVYRLQGIEISDKYIEIIVRQMLSRVQVTDPGDTTLLHGEVISIQKYKIITKEAVINHIKPPLAHHVIYGIKKAPLKSESFLSAASFQDTTRVLMKAIIAGKRDELKGLKENIMLGNLIPAGTGLMSEDKILSLELDAISNEY